MVLGLFWLSVSRISRGRGQWNFCSNFCASRKKDRLWANRHTAPSESLRFLGDALFKITRATQAAWELEPDPHSPSTHIWTSAWLDNPHPTQTHTGKGKGKRQHLLRAIWGVQTLPAALMGQGRVEITSSWSGFRGWVMKVRSLRMSRTRI